MSTPYFNILSGVVYKGTGDNANTYSIKVTYGSLPSGVTVSLSGGTLQWSLSGGRSWTTVRMIDITGSTFTIANLPKDKWTLQLRVITASGTVAISNPKTLVLIETEPPVKKKKKTYTKKIVIKPTTKTTHKKVINHKKKAVVTKVKHKVVTGKGKKPKDNNDDVVPVSPLGLHGYQWNLPPHQWSMPVEPSRDPLIVNTAKYIEGASHKFRRGRIYWYSRVDSSYLTSKSYNDGTDNKDPRYGFQFLWNPSAINTQVAMNLNVTPSFADKFVDVAGAFPSGEYLSFTIRIDRTNDFACIKSIPTKSKAHVAPDTLTTYDYLARYYANTSYYSPNNSLDASFGTTLVTKIKDLQKYGTLADIEYLYKAINGPGWVNQANGRKTSDIGFLSPTLLRIDIGPLSYLGYVNSMGIEHISFARNMVPMISEVSIQFNLMATAGLATK
jgi:hypothetical protein